jgi:hypothetical protein
VTKEVFMGLTNTDEAGIHAQSIPDAVTKNFVNMIYTIALRRCYFDKSDTPTGDFDMAFFVRVLEEFFSDKEVVQRTLNGERVGAWFDESGTA